MRPKVKDCVRRGDGSRDSKPPCPNVPTTLNKDVESGSSKYLIRGLKIVCSNTSPSQLSLHSSLSASPPTCYAGLAISKFVLSVYLVCRIFFHLDPMIMGFTHCSRVERNDLCVKICVGLKKWLIICFPKVNSDNPFRRFNSCFCVENVAVGTEMVNVDEIPFPPQISIATKPLSLLGHGITFDVALSFLWFYSQNWMDNKSSSITSLFFVKLMESDQNVTSE